MHVAKLNIHSLLGVIRLPGVDYAGLDDSISLYEIDTSMRRSFPQGCLI